MNNNIDLCEILKDCPKGTEFYSPLFGKVSFQIADTKIQVRTVCNDTVDFLPDGCMSLFGVASPELMLFPSSSQRDWNKWKCPKPKFDPKTLKSFDKIIYRFDNSGKWRCDFFSHMLTEKTLSVISTYYPIDFCIPYNDDTKHLVGTYDEAPEYYRYWED